MRTVALPLAVLLTSLCASGHAASCTSTLRAALDETLARDPGVGLIEAEQDRAQVLDSESRRWLANAPSVYGSWVSDGPSDDVGLREYEGGVALPLRMPGERGALRQAGTAALQVAELRSENRVLDRAGVLRAAFWALAEARVVHERAEHELEHLEEIRALVSEQVQRGDGAPLDLDLTEIEVEGARVDLRRAEAALAARTHEWSALTGCGEAPAAKPESTAADATPWDASRGADPRLDLALAMQSEADARLAAERARLALPPTLQLLMRRERGEAFAPWIDSVGISITVPVGASSQVREARADAARDLAARASDAAFMARGLATARRSAGARLAAAERALEAATLRARQARSARSRAERAHALGEWNTFDLLRVRGISAEVELDLELARIELGRAAADYNQSHGVLPQ